MNNSANLIDYFVHDLLDYTILSNNVENFMKDNQYFDIGECISQIYEMLEDKIKLKSIVLEIKTTGFQDNGIVFTDKKRF